jgi:hypothetical protein
MSTRRLHALRMLAAVAALVAPTVGWSWLSPAHAADPTCFGQTATIIGTLDDDTLVGTPDPDVIVGLGGADEIVGLGGDDLICADSDGGSAVGPIPDVLRGGGGNDQLLGIAAAEESSRTLASGDAGDDVMTDADLDYRQAPRGVAVRLDVGVARGWGEDTVSGVRRVIGSDFSDVLIGNDVPLDVEGGCGELGCDVLDGVVRATTSWPAGPATIWSSGERTSIHSHRVAVTTACTAAPAGTRSTTSGAPMASLSTWLRSWPLASDATGCAASSGSPALDSLTSFAATEGTM